jgi:hypothetical protein
MGRNASEVVSHPACLGILHMTYTHKDTPSGIGRTGAELLVQ